MEEYDPSRDEVDGDDGLTPNQRREKWKKTQHYMVTIEGINEHGIHDTTAVKMAGDIDFVLPFWAEHQGWTEFKVIDIHPCSYYNH